MVTKTELEIIDIFHNKSMEQDNAIGFMCMLRQCGGCEQMHSWLKKNCNASIEEIQEEVYRLYDQNN